MLKLMKLEIDARSFRNLAWRRDLGAPGPGFAGPGHTVIEVIKPDALTKTDPFVLLMDDRVDFPPGQKVGAPHPHAGLETVTFILEGSLADRDEGLLCEGDVAWMTAGRGVIHNEEVRTTGPARIFQLWITLPESERDAAPRIEILRRDEMPVHRAAGVEARVYTGTSNGVASRVAPYIPVTLVDIRLEQGAWFEQELPATYNGFLVPVSGAVGLGARTMEPPLRAGEIGWLEEGAGVLRLHCPSGPARVLLYAGERKGEPTVQRGPFVAGSVAAIDRMRQDFSAGRFTSLHDVVSLRLRSGQG
jgi:redox-sensitive bicupin YhaK (pirin superfamily)